MSDVPLGLWAIVAPGLRPDPRAASASGATTETSRAVSQRAGDRLAVETRGLSKFYGEVVALRDVDLAVPVGSTYGLIGPNGSGKTTMLSILAGLRRPSAGTVGQAVDRRTGGFSRGMLQRLGLAACLVGDPEVLVLDEPSSALDPSGRREVLDIVGRLAHTKTVLLSTHILADVQQVCDVVGVIDDGRLLFQGPLTDLLARTSSAFALHVASAPTTLGRELSSQPWVEQVHELAPGRFRLVVSDATVAEREIPAVLAANGASLRSFNAATDLESAFLELTS